MVSRAVLSCWSCSTIELRASGLVLVTQLCPALCNPMDCSPPSPSVHGIFQTRILEWVDIPFWTCENTHLQVFFLFNFIENLKKKILLGMPSDVKTVSIYRWENRRLAYCCCSDTPSCWLFATLWIAAHQASLSLTFSQFARFHVHCIGNAVQPSHPLMPSSPSALNLP